MGSDVLLQLAILLLSICMFFALQSFPNQALTRLRSKGRNTAQAHRHFVQGAQFLARAQSSRNRTTAHNLARDAAGEADKALFLQPKDAAPHILKALALDLIGNKSAALKSLDAALSPPAVKSLSDRERSDALFRRAELEVALSRSRPEARPNRSDRGEPAVKASRSRRIDSAVADLVEAVKLSSENGKAYCLLGQCYEAKGMSEEAKKAFDEALRIKPGSAPAREGLDRLG